MACIRDVQGDINLMVRGEARHLLLTFGLLLPTRHLASGVRLALGKIIALVSFKRACQSASWRPTIGGATAA